MPLWGFLLSFLAAAMWAVSPIMVNHGVAISKCSIHEINPYRAVPFFAASFIIALINTGGDITLVTSPLVYLYLFAGVFAGYLLGDLFYFVAIREIGVSLAIPVANGYPILVIFTSWRAGNGKDPLGRHRSRLRCPAASLRRGGEQRDKRRGARAPQQAAADEGLRFRHRRGMLLGPLGSADETCDRNFRAQPD